MIQRSSVHDGLGAVIAAQDDHEVAHHGRLALVIELDLATLFEVIKGRFDHTHRALDDPQASPDRRIGAAYALSLSDKQQAGERVRVVVDTVAHEPVRIALARAAEGELDEAVVTAASETRATACAASATSDAATPPCSTCPGFVLPSANGSAR